MFPEQVAYLNKRIDASLLVNGGPGTGKTVLAIMRAMHLSREGKNVNCSDFFDVEICKARLSLFRNERADMYDVSYI